MSLLKIMGDQKNTRGAILLQSQEGEYSFDMSQGFYETKTRVVLELINEDASGKSSSTATLNGGTKAKRLSITALLPFADKDTLTELVKVAQAVQKDGSREVYIITEETADAMDIREVIFDDRLEVVKAEKLQAWNISFTLKEFQSVPEMTETRGAGQEFSAGGAVGTQVSGSEEEGEELGPSGKIFDILKKVDDYLGGKM